MCVQRLVWMFGLFCWGAVAAAADDGHKRTDELIERIDETVKEMREGRKRVEKTLAAYHDVFSREEKHRRSAYKDLVKSLDKQEERSKKLRERFKRLEKTSEKYFKEWNKSLKDIRKGELRDRSAARLDETRKRYHELIRAGEEAQKRFRPVVEGLEDQVVYLRPEPNVRRKPGDGPSENQRCGSGAHGADRQLRRHRRCLRRLAEPVTIVFASCGTIFASS